MSSINSFSSLQNFSTSSSSSSSSNASENSSSSVERPVAKSRKIGDLTDSRAPSIPLPLPLPLPMHLNLMKIPNALSSYIFSYLPLDERMISQRICLKMNNLIIFNANTHFTFSRKFKKFNDQNLQQCVSKSLLQCIKTLDLQDTAVTNIRALVSIRMPNLTTLSVPSTLTEELVDILGEHCINLTSLDFRSHDFKGRALNEMILPRLKTLNLTDTEVTSADVLSLSASSPFIEKLSIWLCSQLSTTLSGLMLPNLTELDLGMYGNRLYGNKMSNEMLNESITFLSTHSPKLKYLSLGQHCNVDLSLLKFSQLT